jgi:hypothetical protein
MPRGLDTIDHRVVIVAMTRRARASQAGSSRR